MNNNLKEIIEFFKNKYKAKKGDIVLIATDESLYLCKLRNEKNIDMEDGVQGNKELLLIKQSTSPLNIIIDYAAKLMQTNTFNLPEEESLQPSKSMIISNNGKEYSCLKLTNGQFNLLNASFDYINAILEQEAKLKNAQQVPQESDRLRAGVGNKK